MNSIPVICVLAGAPFALAQQTFFSGIGDLPGSTHSSTPYGVSSDGQVVVGHGRSSLHPDGEGYRWTQASGIQGLGPMAPGGMSSARGVSSDGSVIVGYASLSAGAGAAFRWTAALGMVPLAPAPGVTNSGAWGVTADGAVIVGSCTVAGAERAFRWVLTDPATGGGTMTILNPLPGDLTCTALAVSGNGNVVVGISEHNAPVRRTAVRWVNGVITSLGHLPGAPIPISDAYGASATGDFIVGASAAAPPPGSNADRQPFVWNPQTGLTGLGYLAGTLEAEALAVSSDGQTILGTGFIWRPGRGMTPFNDFLWYEYSFAVPGWRNVLPRVMSSDARSIAGTGHNPFNQSEGWLIRLGAPMCYANCDASTTAPVLNVADFSCFLQRFASGDSMANCDQSTAAPILNVSDFTCFLQRFAIGCH